MKILPPPMYTSNPYKCYLYGTGLIAKRILYHFDDAVLIKGFLETAPQNKSFLGYNIYSPDILLQDNDYDFCIIASSAEQEIFRHLTKTGIASEKILRVWDTENYISISDDRLATLRCLAEDLEDRGVSGSVAEVGVFTGAFARWINAAFPNSKLYLFDTFEGFDRRDVDYDLAAGFKNEGIFEGNLKFSDIDAVLNRMPFKEKCIVRKGFFPDTASGIEDSFSFVSLDVDMFKPIYAGLEFFWSRLVKGGCIIVHDYAAKQWPGVKKAVREFSQKNNAPFLPLSDLCGSAVFVKG